MNVITTLEDKECNLNKIQLNPNYITTFELFEFAPNSTISVKQYQNNNNKCKLRKYAIKVYMSGGFCCFIYTNDKIEECEKMLTKFKAALHNNESFDFNTA